MELSSTFTNKLFQSLQKWSNLSAFQLVPWEKVR